MVRISLRHQSEQGCLLARAQHIEIKIGIAGDLLVEHAGEHQRAAAVRRGAQQRVEINALLQIGWQLLEIGFPLIGARRNAAWQLGHAACADFDRFLTSRVEQGHAVFIERVVAINGDRLLIENLRALLAAHLWQPATRQGEGFAHSQFRRTRRPCRFVNHLQWGVCFINPRWIGIDLG